MEKQLENFAKFITSVSSKQFLWCMNKMHECMHAWINAPLYIDIIFHLTFDNLDCYFKRLLLLELNKMKIESGDLQICLSCVLLNDEGPIIWKTRLIWFFLVFFVFLLFLNKKERKRELRTSVFCFCFFARFEHVFFKLSAPRSSYLVHNK